MSEPNRCCNGELLRHDFTDAGIELAVAGFAALWRGDPLSPSDLLPTHLAAALVAKELATHGRAELDAGGRVTGIHGLTMRPTRHRFTVAGRQHQTWCAFDSIGIPAALAVDAVAHTDCPACERQLTIVIHRGEPEPGEPVLWMPNGSVRNLIDDFCAKTDLYCNREHLERAVDTTRISGEVNDLRAAAALGRDTWADVAGLAEVIRSSDGS